MWVLQGTEIKAITYSNMQVQGLEDAAARKEIFLIVDI
jgi:SHS2 domain-containing protein